MSMKLLPQTIKMCGLKEMWGVSFTRRVKLNVSLNSPKNLSWNRPHVFKMVLEVIQCVADHRRFKDWFNISSYSMMVQLKMVPEVANQGPCPPWLPSWRALAPSLPVYLSKHIFVDTLTLSLFSVFVLCLCCRYRRPLQTLWTSAMNMLETTLSSWAFPPQTIPSRTKNPALYCSGCHLALMCFLLFGLLMLLYSFCWDESEGWTVIVSFPCVHLFCSCNSNTMFPKNSHLYWAKKCSLSLYCSFLIILPELWPLTRLWLALSVLVSGTLCCWNNTKQQIFVWTSSVIDSSFLC